jgi:hypothetical protein
MDLADRDEGPGTADDDGSTAEDDPDEPVTGAGVSAGRSG